MTIKCTAETLGAIMLCIMQEQGQFTESYKSSSLCHMLDKNSVVFRHRRELQFFEKPQLPVQGWMSETGRE